DKNGAFIVVVSVNSDGDGDRNGGAFIVVRFVGAFIVNNDRDDKNGAFIVVVSVNSDGDGDRNGGAFIVVLVFFVRFNGDGGGGRAVA
ncbi:MAG: hypothetical protein MPL62_03710, partial [Alphaproteobacteria bacterium]|nr:hypothetical protein [Alphaproteobacteria bacterium]